MLEIELDEHSWYINKDIINNSIEVPKSNFKDLVRGSYEYISKYFSLLTMVDQRIAYLYFIERLKQEQIGNLLGVSQAAISNRLFYIKHKLRFYLKQPSLNPIEVREDFELIFPEDLREGAFYFYWETTQSRVKYFIEMGQSGAANKLSKVISYLEKTKNRLESKKDMTDEEERLYCSALIYLEYFQYIRGNSRAHKSLFKKNDLYRANTLYLGKDITKT